MRGIYVAFLIAAMVLASSLVAATLCGTYNLFWLQAPGVSAETPKVILQSGIVGNSTIYMNSTSASVSVSRAQPYSNATIFYVSNTGAYLLQSPKERTWNGTAWSSPEAELQSAGNTIQWVRAAYCPIAARYYEEIVVTLCSADDYLDAYVWNGSAWIVSNNIGQVNNGGADGCQSFDVAYETSSGNALLVYAVKSSIGSQDLAYLIWNGTSWSNTSYIDDPQHSAHANYWWVEIEPSPIIGSNEITLIGMDHQNADCSGWIWNGSAWGHYQELQTGLASVMSYKLISLAYEKNTGRAMFAWAYNGYMESRIWNGTGWESSLPAVSISNGNVRWVTLKADPASNGLMAITIDGGSNLDSVFWNGTAWGAPTIHDNGVSNPDDRCADFDWEPSGSRGLLVWSSAQNSVSYKTYNLTTGWSNVSTAANLGNHPWVQLRGNPRDTGSAGGAKILGATLNSDNDIFGLRWNGTILTFESAAFTTDTSFRSSECFDVTFQRAYPIGSQDFDYVLRTTNQVSSSWEISLVLFNSSNISRLSNMTIGIHDGSFSSQIIIQNGSVMQSQGTPYNLTGATTAYISIQGLKANGSGVSLVYAWLKVKVPLTPTYNLLPLAFSIS